MRRQVEELADAIQLSPERRQQLSIAAWHLWLTYLAVTGELGEAAWLRAARAPVRAARLMFHPFSSTVLKCMAENRRYVQRSRKTLKPRNPSWGSVRVKLPPFIWEGWGGLYDPREGLQTKELAMSGRSKK